jgi:hypothetical protein
MNKKHPIFASILEIILSISAATVVLSIGNAVIYAAAALLEAL